MNSEAVHFEDETQDAAADSLSETTPRLDRIANRIQSLEKWYAADFERRIAALATFVENQVRQDLRAQIPDASSVGKLLESRVEEMALKAYLRGLKFCLEK